jgi:hypothetical protein
MATILTAPNRLTAAQKRTTTTLYLAGPFNDETTSWRDEVIGALDDLDITIIDPRNERWPQLGVGTPGRRGAYDWQCAAAYAPDVVIVVGGDGWDGPVQLFGQNHRFLPLGEDLGDHPHRPNPTRADDRGQERMSRRSWRAALGSLWQRMTTRGPCGRRFCRNGCGRGGCDRGRPLIS